MGTTMSERPGEIVAPERLLLPKRLRAPEVVTLLGDIRRRTAAGTLILTAYLVFLHSFLRMAFGRWQWFSEELAAGMSLAFVAALSIAEWLTKRAFLDELCVGTGSEFGDEVMTRASPVMRA